MVDKNTSRSRKRVSKSSLFVSACIATILGGCLLPLASFLPAHFSPVPEDLREPRVLVGEGFLEKDVFLEIHENVSEPFRDITSIRQIRWTDGDSDVIAAFEGTRHAHSVDPSTGELRSSVTLEDGCSSGDFVDVEGDGTPEFMCRGGGFGEVGLFDVAGKLLWGKSGSFLDSDGPASHMSAGDLNGDGVLEFCVAFGGSGSVACFDATGAELWRAGEDDWYENVAIITDNSDRAGQVVALADSGSFQYSLEFRDADGELLRRVVLPTYTTGEFRLIPWPVGQETPSILMRTDSTVLILDMEGNVIFEHALPSEWTGHGIEGAVVRFDGGADEDPYLAILFGFWRTWDRVSLLVFSMAGELVYQEILRDGSGLLATELSAQASLSEVLLVSDGPSKVVSYRRAGGEP